MTPPPTRATSDVLFEMERNTAIATMASDDGGGFLHARFLCFTLTLRALRCNAMQQAADTARVPRVA